jgi:hypothetical protein
MPRVTARRSLSEREKEILRFLLSVQSPPELADTVASLALQVDRARVIERWDCCPSVEFAIGRDDPPHLSEAVPMIEAHHESRPYDLLLVVTKHGDLRSLEVVHYDDSHLDEIPPVAEFDAPTAIFEGPDREERRGRSPSRDF